MNTPQLTLCLALISVRDKLMGKQQENSDGSQGSGARGGMCGCFTLAYYKPVRSKMREFALQ